MLYTHYMYARVRCVSHSFKYSVISEQRDFGVAVPTARASPSKVGHFATTMRARCKVRHKLPIA